MTDDHPISASVTRDETSRSLALWAGILVGPLAWTLQVFVAPDLNEVLCYAGAGSSRGQLYGIATETFIAVLTGVLLGATAVAGLVSYRCLRRGTVDAEPYVERATWMARAGVLVSVLFFLAIAIGLLPVVLLDACEVLP